MPTSKTLAVFDALAGRPPSSGYPQLDVRNNHVVLDFDDTADESIDLMGVLPGGYVGGDFDVMITWAASTATSGDVVWQAEFERHPIGDPTHGTLDLDTDDFPTAETGTGSAPGSAGELVQTTVRIAAADADTPAAGETFRLRLTRLASNGADTMTGDAELLAVELREV